MIEYSFANGRRLSTRPDLLFWSHVVIKDGCWGWSGSMFVRHLLAEAA